MPNVGGKHSLIPVYATAFMIPAQIRTTQSGKIVCDNLKLSDVRYHYGKPSWCYFDVLYSDRLFSPSITPFGALADTQSCAPAKSVTSSPSRFRPLDGSVPPPSNIGSSSSSATQTTLTPVPPEVESTLTRIMSARNVRGVMVLSKDGAMIRHTGPAFEGETGRNYAIAVKRIVDACRVGLEEAHGNTNEADSENKTDVVSYIHDSHDARLWGLRGASSLVGRGQVYPDPDKKT